MNFNDSDWTLEAAEPAPPSTPRPVSLAFGVGVGIVIGAVLASLAWLWVDARRAPALPVPAVSANLAAVPATGVRDAVPAEAPASAAAAQQAGDANAALAISAASAPSGPAASPAHRAGMGASAPRDARKEQAWALYYHRPAQCEGNPTPQQMIDCANDHIRARRRFEADYAAGRL